MGTGQGRKVEYLKTCLAQNKNCNVISKSHWTVRISINKISSLTQAPTFRHVCEFGLTHFCYFSLHSCHTVKAIFIFSKLHVQSFLVSTFFFLLEGQIDTPWVGSLLTFVTYYTESLVQQSWHLRFMWHLKQLIETKMQRRKSWDWA